MVRTVGIGIQDFEKLMDNNLFYVDKTHFIKEWWENHDDVTLITRPRRFGKTLNMSMLTYFFSNRYDRQEEIFRNLQIWEEEKYRKLAGTYPVISLSFADVKDRTYEGAVFTICEVIKDLYNLHAFLKDSDKLTEAEKAVVCKWMYEISEKEAAIAIRRLAGYLYKHYGKKVLIFLDEYDTPMQEAYVNGYWDEFTAFIRSMFNATFKTNPYYEKTIMTGITRVSKESIFSDLNNLEVVTTTSNKYATCFGILEQEVFSAMDEMGFVENEREKVKKWYDGFTFGTVADIYNPWSIINYLDKREFSTYWANTSGNGLVGKLIQEGDPELKVQFEELLRGGSIEVPIDEQIVFNQLDSDKDAVWSLFLASGYLKYISVTDVEDELPLYRLALTNYEVMRMFKKMIRGWFKKSGAFSEFVASMMKGDVESMNHYMERVALNTFSYFDAGNQSSETEEPERFYHGFVLGLLVENAVDYTIRSNRESGFGRYDVVMEPKNRSDVAVVMEFKVFNPDKEESLSDTAENALVQIEEKKYAADLLDRGVPEDRILKYGIAFQGKHCLIQMGSRSLRSHLVGKRRKGIVAG